MLKRIYIISFSSLFLLLTFLLSGYYLPFRDIDNDGYTVLEGDCNDLDESKNPGEPERCDLKDQDCDRDIDEYLPLFAYYVDSDSDGYGDKYRDPVYNCIQKVGFSDNNSDCDDRNNQINPYIKEIANNGTDENCNTIDGGFANNLDHDIVSLSAGFDHSIILFNDGTIWGWGANDYGQLGNGVDLEIFIPMPIDSINNVADISSGYSHSLAVKDDGTVWAWGSNFYGQLGIGDLEDSDYPTNISLLSNGKNVSAGYRHSLAITQNGSIYAWGSNSYGELGTGDNVSTYFPVLVDDIHDIQKIFAMGHHSFALGNYGNIWAWGSNNYGELGDGTFVSKTKPFSLSTISNVVEIAPAFNTTLALKSDGTVWGWGDYSNGLLGGGDFGNRSKNSLKETAYPIQIPFSERIIKIRSGFAHAIAMDSKLNFWSWGSNSEGQLGVNSFSDKEEIPIKISSISNKKDFTLGSYNSFAWNGLSDLSSWGSNNYGELGLGASASESRLKNIDGPSDVSIVTSGYGFTIAFASHQKLWSFGKNDYGQLGDGTTIFRSKPISININQSFIDMDSGFETTYAIDVNNQLWSWGKNSSGVLGLGFDESSLPFMATPSAISVGSEHFSKVSSLYQHALALTTEGDVYSWGANSFGQLGDGTLGDRSSPVLLEKLYYDIVDITAGEMHSMALASNGTIYSWGDNGFGQLGLGDDVTLTTKPKVIESFDGIERIFSNAYTSFAINGSNEIFSWGGNSKGQLGYGYVLNSFTPVEILQYSDALYLWAGYDNAIALSSDGTIWGWGGNSFSQVGDYGKITQFQPVILHQMNNQNNRVLNFSAGFFNNTAIVSSEDKSELVLQGWGYNQMSQSSSEFNYAIPNNIVFE